MHAPAGITLVDILRRGGGSTLVLLRDPLRRQNRPNNLPCLHSAPHIQPGLRIPPLQPDLDTADRHELPTQGQPNDAEDADGPGDLLAAEFYTNLLLFDNQLPQHEAEHALA